VLDAVLPVMVLIWVRGVTVNKARLAVAPEEIVVDADSATV
jgi:hypothetical protein